jgi:Zn-dependent protease
VSGATANACPDCATPVASALLSCPACQALIHGERLRQLAADAEAADRAGNVTAALEGWRTALTWLPPQSRQAAAITARVQRLTAQLDAAPDALPPPIPNAPERKRGWMGGALAGAALLAWKFKALIVIVLTKGKLLLFGLTKSSTLFSMLASLGVYWTAFGWRFAAGLVGSIYVHEMGHVAALRRLGIPASAPMFIPGLGAMVRLRQNPVDARENARVGLAGPIWGLGAAVAAFALWAAGFGAIWGAIGHVGAWLNLFNLLPIWQLDGGRAFDAMSRRQRAIACAILAAMFLVTREGLLVLLVLAAGFQIFRAPTDRDGDRTSLLHYAALVVVLSVMCMIRVDV